MPIPLYLAMTAAEMHCCDQLPEKSAWMACHFSPGGPGLTNLPTELPPDSLLILDDSTPIKGHDPDRVCGELQVIAQACAGLVLDFERPTSEESLAMAAKIAALPCPVYVAAAYAHDLNCSVFLPPVPLLKTVAEYLKPWTGRGVCLDCAPAALTVTVTEKGSHTAPLSLFDGPECPHFDDELHCHYRLDLSEKQAVFTLRRTREDLSLLLQAARKWGVTQGIALWQELLP